MSDTLVSFSDRFESGRLPASESMILYILDADLRSAHFALEDYEAVDMDKQPIGDKVSRIINSAMNFVCAMRRTARVIEAIGRKSNNIPGPVAQAAKLAWKKSRIMFETYTEPRNAIEHVVLELEKQSKTKTILIMFNLINNRLEVTPEITAEISRENLRAAVRARNEIMQALACKCGNEERDRQTG